MVGSFEFPGIVKDLQHGIRGRTQSGQVVLTGGAHAGARFELADRPVSIGSDLENDLVLIGDSVAAHHARLAFADLLGRKLLVEAHHEGVAIDGHGTLPQGYSVEVPLPATLSLGSAKLRVEGTVPAVTLPNSKVLAGVISLVASVVLLFSVSGTTRAVVLGPSSAPQVHAVASHQILDREAAMAKVAALLSSAGLADRIAVMVDENGTMALKGRLSGPKAMAAWRAFLVASDSESDLPPILQAVQISEIAAKPPAISSVWFGSTPKVMMSDGHQLGVGETSAEGWHLESLTHSEAIFTGEGREAVRISLN